MPSLNSWSDKGGCMARKIKDTNGKTPATRLPAGVKISADQNPAIKAKFRDAAECEIAGGVGVPKYLRRARIRAHAAP